MLSINYNEKSRNYFTPNMRFKVVLMATDK